MSFKFHIAAISAIIIAVLIFWHASESSRLPQGQQVVIDTSSNIIIVRASWGLNCIERFGNLPALQPDNIKQKVSALCDGKRECNINPSDLKPDPLPQCNEKNLEVEYRCFSFDRLWEAKSGGGAVTIKCADSQKNIPASKE